MYNSKILKEKCVSFVKLFNEIISSTVVWENDMPMFVLFAGAGCSASSGVALGGRMVQIVQKYSYLKESEEGIYILAKLRRNEETLESLIQKYEGEIDEEQFNNYVSEKRKQFFKKYDDKKNKIELLKTLPLSLQKLIYKENGCEDITCLEDDKLEVIWNEYKSKLLADLEYGFWMQEYSPESSKIQELMEEFIENKTPAFEYYLLADLINQGMLFNIFTTNFDNFIHEAMSFLGTRARVCIYDDKASSISYNRKKPNIIKLHGEYLYNNTKNYINETHDLGGCLNEKFKEALKKFGMIVVGYQGNDYSIMHVLEELKKERPYPLYWCVREVDLHKVSWRVVELINNTPLSYIVPIKDFRTFVVDLWNYWNKAYDVEQSSIRKVVQKTKNIQQELTKVIHEQSYKNNQLFNFNGIIFDEFLKEQLNLPKSPFALWKNEDSNLFNINYDYVSSYSIEKARMFIAEMPLYKQKVVECIIDLLADHIYMTTKQIYLSLYLKDCFYGDQNNLFMMIKSLKDAKILAIYYFKSPQANKGRLNVISLDLVGAKMYQARKKRQANWSRSIVTNTTVFDMKRILSANQFITEALKWSDILFEIRPKLGGTKDGLNAVRPTAKILFSLNGEEYFGIFECIRDFSGWQEQLYKKFKRYDSFLTQFREYKIPVLILCGECAEQTKEIFYVLDNYIKKELNKYRESKINYSNVWFTFDRILLNEKFDHSFFNLYIKDEQLYTVNIDVNSFVTHEFQGILPVQSFESQNENIEQREKIVCLLHDFFREQKVSNRLISFNKMGSFNDFLNKKGLTIQEFGYTKIFDLLDDLSENFYKFVLNVENEKSIECITCNNKSKDNGADAFLKEVCENEDSKSRLQDIMLLVYRKNKNEILETNTLKQILSTEHKMESTEKSGLDQYIYNLPNIFYIYMYGKKECVKLTLDMGIED